MAFLIWKKSKKIIITITDHPGHTGTGDVFTRDCTIDNTVNMFNTISKGSEENFIFFYSVPQKIMPYIPGPCINYKYAKN